MHFIKNTIQPITSLIVLPIVCSGFVAIQLHQIDVSSCCSCYRHNHHPLNNNKCFPSFSQLSSTSTELDSISLEPSTSTSSIDSSDVNEDSSFQEYSRCLSPQEEYDQINSELGMDLPNSWWRRVLALTSLKRSIKAFKKIIGLNHNSKPGTLILIRGGESEFSINYTFTGWV